MVVKCKCGLECAVRESEDIGKGKNYKRPFFTCAGTRETKCGFFLWVDESQCMLGIDGDKAANAALKNEIISLKKEILSLKRQNAEMEKALGLEKKDEVQEKKKKRVIDEEDEEKKKKQLEDDLLVIESDEEGAIKDGKKEDLKQPTWLQTLKTKKQKTN